MRVFFLLIFYFFGANFMINAQKIKIEFNLENVTSVVDFFKKRNKDTLSAKDILKLDATKGMIKHDSRFDEKINKENFVKELVNENSLTDFYGFKKIRKDIKKIDELKRYIIKNSNEFKEKIIGNISNFLPNNDLDVITVYFVIGGNSDGYTDGKSFYIELQYFDKDIEGLTLLMTHELYHIYQQRINTFLPKIARMAFEEQKKYLILGNTFLEGVASYISNPLLIENPGEYTKSYQKKYKRNINKLQDSFLLFEILLYYSINHNSNVGTLYNLGFGGSWDSPFYFVGFEICNQIEKIKGVNSIATYIQEPPTQIFVDYIELYKRENSIPYKFSAKTELIIKELHKRLIKS